MRRYGLIGWPLGHSFSKGYFTEKFRREGISDACYELFPLESVGKLPDLLAQHPDLCGLNVTIPYKEQVIPFLHQMDATASHVGAVNCIRILPGQQLKGYNTDVIGFERSLLSMSGWHPELGSALILGTGGASKAVAYVLDRLGVPYHLVSRKPSSPRETGYSDLEKEVSTCRLIVNTTPLGTYPDVHEMPPFPVELFQTGMFVFDLIYNPAETLLLHEAKQRGCTIKNGLEMLELQAEAAWDIWQQ
ncbi:MAG: shikimate dehydrogenase [Saprospiraceae bacterium]|nr:shikimate dehydrogenase [Saprospiraceae bacterium]